jgi:hypothetical protein
MEARFENDKIADSFHRTNEVIKIRMNTIRKQS